MSKIVEEYGNAREFNAKLEAIKNLMTNLKWIVEQAMQALNISQEEQIIKGMIK